MKRIGILGGMSWESTQLYIDGLCKGVRARLGGLSSPEFVIVGVNFAEIAPMQSAGLWDEIGDILASHAREIEEAGAEALVLATNTMHKLAPQIEDAIDMPFLHIGDATARAITAQGLARVGLLGTSFTMEEDFYLGRFASAGIETIVPDAAGRALVNRVIFDELCAGVYREESKDAFRKIMRDLKDAGAQGIVLGCTEIPLLVGPGDIDLPVIDTARVHVAAALEFMLKDAADA